MPRIIFGVTTQHFQHIRQRMTTSANLRTTSNVQWWKGYKFKLPILTYIIKKACTAITKFDAGTDMVKANSVATTKGWLQDRVHYRSITESTWDKQMQELWDDVVYETTETQRMQSREKTTEIPTHIATLNIISRNVVLLLHDKYET